LSEDVVAIVNHRKDHLHRNRHSGSLGIPR